MSEETPGILSHVALDTNAVERAVAFYDTVLTLVGKRIMKHAGTVA